MPFTAKTFRERHNKRLSDAQAKTASLMVNAMMRRGVPEGEAIATANKHVEKRGFRSTAMSIATRRKAA